MLILAPGRVPLPLLYRLPAAYRSRRRSCMTAAMDATRGSEDGRRLAGTMAAVATGDRAAMATLYTRTSAKLFGICVRILGSEAEAEEALQETYILVWRKAGAFDPGRASAITWLAILARNASMDRLRRRRGPAAEELGAALEIADEAPLAPELLEQAEDRERLTRCLDELEDKPRSAIRAAFLDGLSYPDLAAREGVPLPTMKSWVRRGLLRLRGCLER
jgi:RNA polymerase sigma-70 factor (ECF subfamily)